MNTVPTPRPQRPLAVRDGRTVPYITLWSGERHTSLVHLLLDTGGLRYSDEGVRTGTSSAACGSAGTAATATANLSGGWSTPNASAPRWSICCARCAPIPLTAPPRACCSWGQAV
ncbi:hypothetical protein [Streptomyces sp. Ac-502]|uniref:hypothetical protein n=1 Tax=Streptomyces sp. Ac-502 TaxID=3342801 RepID=UPI003862C519